VKTLGVMMFQSPTLPHPGVLPHPATAFFVCNASQKPFFPPGSPINRIFFRGLTLKDGSPAEDGALSSDPSEVVEKHFPKGIFFSEPVSAGALVQEEVRSLQRKVREAVRRSPRFDSSYVSSPGTDMPSLDNESRHLFGSRELSSDFNRS